ncbi:hypothetical protein [Bacillus sp. BP-3]|uniref:hypothetical protein n=1 Tax=Bacillus sp. BP-3 TaxID=3022773 RepID=UPI00232BEE9D|nr:hypothetical protein [Bacillus sp. BP-3]MDC2867855.1 hypothetical protein [Bacillus sp. BP-3]
MQEFWNFAPEPCYHETIDHLMDSIYQFIESIDKNPDAILSRIQRADMSIF